MRQNRRRTAQHVYQYSARGRRDGFTLIELLISVAILGILLALLMPGLQAVRESSRRLHCSNNFRQIGLAISNYEVQLGQFPSSHTLSPHRHSLAAFLLPYLGEQPIHDSYQWDTDWDAPANAVATRSDISTLRCPSAPAARQFVTDYAACLSLRSPARRDLLSREIISNRRSWISILQNTKTTSAMVLDGLSNSWMLYEDAGRPSKFAGGFRTRGSARGARWADPQSTFAIHTTCRGDSMINCKNDNEIYSFHRKGCNFLYGDGSVRFITQDVSPETLAALLTREAGDITPDAP